MAIDTDMIISSIISVLFFALFALMVYQSIKKNRTAYVLTISLLIGGIGGIVSVLQYVFTSLSKYFLYSSLIIWSIVYFLIYIFFEELYTVKPDRFRFALATLLLFASILFNLLYLFLPSSGDLGLSGLQLQRYEIYSEVLQWSWDSTYNLLGLLIFAFGAYVHFKAYQFTKEIITLVQAISMCIIGAGFVVGFIGGDVFHQSIFFSIGDGVKILGMLLFTLIYAIRFDFVYRLPVNVYFILVFTKYGLNIHISRVHDASKEEQLTDEDFEQKIINENLLSSLITAISGLLNESLGSKKELRAIIAEDRTMVLDSGEFATCATLCDRPTFFLQKSLRNLIRAIEHNYGSKLSQTAIIKEDFQEVDKLIRANFPFLEIDRLNKNKLEKEN